MSRLKEILLDSTLGIFYMVIGIITAVLYFYNPHIMLGLLAIVVFAIGIVYLIMGIVLGEADRK